MTYAGIIKEINGIIETKSDEEIRAIALKKLEEVVSVDPRSVGFASEVVKKIGVFTGKSLRAWANIAFVLPRACNKQWENADTYAAACQKQLNELKE